MTPTLIMWAGSTVIASIVGFGLAWQLQAGNITEIELKATNDQLSLQRENLKAAEGYTEKLAAIQKRSTVRASKLRVRIASATNAGNGLRITTQDSVLKARQDSTVCSDTATTLGELLTTVSAERRELAEAADRHVIDIQALIERQAQ